MKKILALCMSVILVLSLYACSFNFSTANFQNLVMASEINEDTFKPITATNTFTTNTPVVYLTGTLKNAMEGTVIKATWRYIENDPASDMDSVTYTVENTNTDFQFNMPMPTDGWQAGKYEVILYIDDKPEKAVPFTVKANSADLTTIAPETTSAIPETTAAISEAQVAYFQDLTTGEGIDEETYKPITVTSTFSTTSPTFYLSGSLINAKIGDEIKGYWQYVQNDPAVDIDTSTLAIENVDTDFYFSLDKPDDGWQPGRYKVLLYINDVYDTTVNFDVV